MRRASPLGGPEPGVDQLGIGLQRHRGHSEPDRRATRRWPRRFTEAPAHEQQTRDADRPPAAPSATGPEGQRCNTPMPMPTVCRQPVATTKPSL